MMMMMKVGKVNHN